MKTLFKQQHHYKWTHLKNFAGTLGSGLYSLFSYSEPLQQLTFLVQRSRLNPNTTALVSKVVASLVTVKSLLKTRLLNDRIFLALVLFGAAPFAACIHLFFNRKEVVPQLADYHENYFHLFNLLGPYLFCLVVLTGVSLLIPRKERTFKIFKRPLQVQLNRIIAIPFAFTISKLIWLYQTKSNEDFWSLPHWTYVAWSLLIGYVYYLLIEWLTWRKYHAFDGLLATLEGLYKIDLPEEVRREKALPLIKELKQFNSKY